MSAGALIAVAVGADGTAMVLVAASLEAFLGLCLGCHLFRLLIRLGLVPPETCEACVDLWGRAEQSWVIRRVGVC